jgi:hypothetical protein
MADICVIYASEDETVVYKLVSLLRNYWDVWWAADITQGDWEQEILDNISNANAVVPVLSHNTKSKPIFKD